jgi:CRP-like cAMP-binding protein
MVTIIEKVLQLQDIDLFGSAYTEHLAQFASVCQEKGVAADANLFQRGHECDTLYILLEGRVELGSETGARTAVQKCALDLWSFLSQGNHQHSAKALDNCRLLTVSFDEMVDLLTAEPEFCWAVTKHLAQLGRAAQIPPLPAGLES